MTREEKKRLKQIADGLPKIEIEGGTVVYRHKMGHSLTKSDVNVLRVAMKKDEDWKPNPKQKYILIDETKKYHDHYARLCIEWNERGNFGVDRYILSARNLAATINKAKEDLKNESK